MAQANPFKPPFTLQKNVYNSDGSLTQSDFLYSDNAPMGVNVRTFSAAVMNGSLDTTTAVIRNSPTTGIPFALNPTGDTEALGLSFVGTLRQIIETGRMTRAEVLAKVGTASVNVQDWMLTATTMPTQIKLSNVPDIDASFGSVTVGTIASSKAIGLASANLTIADVLNRPTAWLEMGPSKSGVAQPWTVTGDFTQAVKNAWSDIPTVNNFTVKGLGFVTGASATITTPKGTMPTLNAPATDANAIAVQMGVVYLGRPTSHALMNTLEKLNGGAQPNAAALKAVSAISIQDGAFGGNDNSAAVVTNTFKNIMGFLPSTFEQNEWGKYIDNGTLTKDNAPWIIFQSYLGATNVPAVYQQPTQARFVAAQTFTDNIVTAAQEAGLNQLNSAFSQAAQGWLKPVASVADASARMTTLIADIDTVTLVGVVPTV